MTVVLERGIDDVKGRRLFSLAIASTADLPKPIVLPSRNFVCLLAWEARGASTASISELVEPLVQAGASYFVCWGPNCERVHDIIDEIAAHPSSGVPTDSCIMATWHDDESLEDAIWYFLVNTQPDAHYEETTHASLAISVTSEAWEAEIVAALRNPRAFIGRASASGAA